MKKKSDTKQKIKKNTYVLLDKNGKRTNHEARNKGPSDAAAKLSRWVFNGSKKNNDKVKFSVEKISRGKNYGAIYYFEVTQKLVPIEKGEKVPKGIRQNGKRWKRIPKKLDTLTPTKRKKLEAQARRNEKTKRTKGGSSNRNKEINYDEYYIYDEYESDYDD